MLTAVFLSTIHKGKNTEKVLHQHILKKNSQKSVRLISNTVVAVALYMLYMYHLYIFLLVFKQELVTSYFF